MTEAQLLAKITSLATARKLLWHHCTDSRHCTGPGGFPDLIIAGPRGIIFAELKTEDGETSAGQDLWNWTLNEVDMLCGRECERSGSLSVIWRPADLLNGTIEREMSFLA